MKTWEERDLAHIWHPCSQMKDYETLPPMVIDHGKGVWLYDIHGKKYLDIVSSWWANLLGHANPDINAAIKEQIDKLEHVIFANFSHRPAIELAEKLADITPARINKFHFNDNGSSSVEAALKMCFQFYHQTGKPEKQRFMCLSEGYHGETIGALSVGIGFGLNTVINHFVCGLILMIERPIQPGDCVEISGTSGKIRDIGIRTTTITTFDGADVLVPNGLLLSEKLTNWTLSNRRRRIEVAVGVAYDCAPREVQALLLEVAHKIAGVSLEPPPAVVFTGFGESSLNFVVRVWTDDFDLGGDIGSEMALEIHAALQAAGIEIPFPQRDLHIRSIDAGVVAKKHRFIVMNAFVFKQTRIKQLVPAQRSVKAAGLKRIQ